MEHLLDQIWQLLTVLFDSQALMETLKQPDFLVAAFVVLNLVIFTETGLLIGFCLPGDSLLVTAGIVFHNLIYVQGCSGWLLPLLLLTLCIAAIVGDSVGYLIGRRAGVRLYSRKESFFFRKNHLLAAQAFYQKHGGKTIVLARFMPFLRTFAPVVAGTAQMKYRRFVLFNIAGGIGWVCSMIMLGFILTPVLNPLLQPLLGAQFRVEKYIEVVIIVVVLVSISPGVFAWARHKLVKRKSTTNLV